MVKRLLFLDGTAIPSSEKLMANLAPGHLRGKGVFETMRAYRGIIFLLDEHLKRLFYGLKKMRIPLPTTKNKIRNYLEESLQSNKLKNARVRLAVWQGKKQVRTSIITWPYTPVKAFLYRKGYKAIFVDMPRKKEIHDPGIKSTDYLPFLLAYRKAKVQGCDEAVLLDKDHFISEGSRSNIFIVNKQTLLTPQLSSGCLKGITRQLIIKLARGMGIKTKQVLLKPQDLCEAQEAFLTNSVIELMPLTFVNHKKISKGTIGPITSDLRQAYHLYVQETIPRM